MEQDWHCHQPQPGLALLQEINNESPLSGGFYYYIFISYAGIDANNIHFLPTYLLYLAITVIKQVAK